MADLSFSSAIKEWLNDVPEAVEAVRNQSAQDVVEDMQTPRAEGGRMRVATGFLRGSLLASTSAMPKIDPNAAPPSDASPNSYSYDFGQIEGVIINANLASSLYFGYTASYASFREYLGSHGQPDAFVRTAAQKWPQIVERNTSRVKQAFGL